MNPETPYRIAVLIVFGLAMAVGIPHRVRAKTDERISRRDEGWFVLITLRLAGLALWVGSVTYLVSPASMAWAAMPLPPAVRWAGLVFGALGVAMMYWTLTNLGKNLTDTVTVRSNATLVTQGPYRYVRHPFYVTAGLMILGVTLLSANAFIGLTGLAVLVLLAVRTPNEERKLLERFGEPYRAYRARTGAFFPRWPAPR